MLDLTATCVRGFSRYHTEPRRLQKLMRICVRLKSVSELGSLQIRTLVIAGSPFLLAGYLQICVSLPRGSRLLRFLLACLGRPCTPFAVLAFGRCRWCTPHRIIFGMAIPWVFKDYCVGILKIMVSGGCVFGCFWAQFDSCVSLCREDLLHRLHCRLHLVPHPFGAGLTFYFICVA